jgi:hypothetical protein
MDDHYSPPKAPLVESDALTPGELRWRRMVTAAISGFVTLLGYCVLAELADDGSSFEWGNLLIRIAAVSVATGLSVFSLEVNNRLVVALIAAPVAIFAAIILGYTLRKFGL